MRLFLAINLPREMKEALSRELVRFDYLKFHEIPKEQWHVTVKFIGEVHDDAVSSIRECVAPIASTTKSFEITIEDVGFLNPRIFSFTIEKSPKLFGMVRIIDERLSSRGIAPFETRPFRGHITVGRKHPPVRSEFHSLRHFDLKAREPLSFIVSSVELMESVLTEKGAVYTMVERYPLKV